MGKVAIETFASRCEGMLGRMKGGPGEVNCGGDLHG